MLETISNYETKRTNKNKLAICGSNLNIWRACNITSKNIYKNDTLFGGSYILISATLSYSSFKEAELLKQEGHKLFNLPIYASGVLSGMWLIRALELFF